MTNRVMRIALMPADRRRIPRVIVVSAIPNQADSHRISMSFGEISIASCLDSSVAGMVVDAGLPMVEAAFSRT